MDGAEIQLALTQRTRKGAFIPGKGATTRELISDIPHPLFFMAYAGGVIA